MKLNKIIKNILIALPGTVMSVCFFSMKYEPGINIKDIRLGILFFIFFFVGFQFFKIQGN